MKLLMPFLFFFLSVIANCQTNNGNSKMLLNSDSSLKYPSLNRAWTPNELQQVLDTIIEKQKDIRFNSPSFDNENKELFIKLTDFESYWFLQPPYFDFYERLQSLSIIVRKVNKLSLSYYHKSTNENGKLSYNKEVISLISLSMKLAKCEVETEEALVKSNPNLSENQLEGIKKTVYGLSTMIYGGLSIIETDYFRFTDNSICLFCSSFMEFYTFMRNRINQDTRNEDDTTIKRIIKTHKLECVRNILSKLNI